MYVDCASPWIRARGFIGVHVSALGEARLVTGFVAQETIDIDCCCGCCGCCGGGGYCRYSVHPLSFLPPLTHPIHLHSSAPSHHQGNTEYKLKLVDPTPERIQHLTTQLKWRLAEGSNEAIYEVGVQVHS